MTIIDYYFNPSGAGSFESALFNAWKLASVGNRRKLENAFSENFPVARMYGVTPFYEFASYEQYEKAVLPHIVKMNQWGVMVEAVHLPWSEIKKREHLPAMSYERSLFKPHNRAFGSFVDPASGKEVDSLCFGDYTCDRNILWYVTEEKLDDIWKDC